jgi:hypothetical protein
MRLSCCTPCTREWIFQGGSPDFHSALEQWLAHRDACRVETVNRPAFSFVGMWNRAGRVAVVDRPASTLDRIEVTA